MAWYNNWLEKIFDRPTASVGGVSSNTTEGSETNVKFIDGYEKIESVNRAVNMIVDDCSALDYNVGDNFPGVVRGTKKVTLNNLLNRYPNPYQDKSDFRRRLFVDYILEGNIFVYYNGVHLYHLPAKYMSIKGDEREYIDKYVYQEAPHAGKQEYDPKEIIHIRENSFSNKFRGTSRLKSMTTTISTVIKMKEFQENFFKNSAVPGLVITTENSLGKRTRDTLLETWQKIYNPTTGGKRPLILDSGMKVDPISNTDFKDLDFSDGIKLLENVVIKGIGVPPVLIDSGNNANLRPNMRLYYLETILPIVEKLLAGLERYFGYELEPDISDIPALQPELQEAANYYTSLVNGGVISPNEAREDLGRERMDGLDEIRVPANIAGSAADPSEGGRPPEGEE